MCFSLIFLILNYPNFNIGMFVSRSSILVQAGQKIFGIIKKGGQGSKQALAGGLEKKLKINKRGGTQE